MTEAEWAISNEPDSMLFHVRDRASQRKLRLFAIACCRHLWRRLGNDRTRDPVMVAERYADGLADQTQLQAASHAVEEIGMEAYGAAWIGDTHGWATWQTRGAFEVATARPIEIRSVWHMAASVWRTGKEQQEREALSNYLRCLFGNPFEPVALEAAWLTPAVRGIAFAIYDQQSFDRLLILADALEGAGCLHAGMLAHCRGPGPHVKGCWVVDLVLERREHPGVGRI
jgi:hypothetical protein